MKNIEKIIIPVIIIAAVTALACFYISKEYKKQQKEMRLEEIEETLLEETEDEVVSKEELSYDSIAILVGKNEEEKLLTFMSVQNNKIFKVSYDGTTLFTGKHGNSLSLAQIQLGEILDINYSTHTGKLNTAGISSDVWTMTDVSKFEINQDKKLMVIAGENYKLPKSTIVSYGDELAEMIDITDVDTLTVKGIDRRVYSIIVDKGHGYVRLLNDSYFVGGWIEIGQNIIRAVSEDMLLAVPEGNYHVYISNRGYAGEKDIEVKRDKETEIDLSEIEIREVSIGHVLFNIEPDFAQLFVDDKMVDFEDRVSLEYGIHKVHAELAGYESVDMSIKVSSDYSDVTIGLEKSQSSSGLSKSSSTAAESGFSSSSSSQASYYLGSTSSSSSVGTIVSTTSGSTSGSASSSSTFNTSSSSSTSSSTSYIVSTNNKMYVESPVGAEVYVDGIYIGICPASAIKPASGTHVITLSKNGYATKSYTITSSDDGKDLTLSFSELLSQ